MLPLIKPALAALTIFAFMGSWNNFIGMLVHLSSPASPRAAGTDHIAENPVPCRQAG